MPHAKSAAVLCTRRPQDQDFFLMWPQGGTIKSTGARTRKRALGPKIENPKGMLVTEYLIQCTKIIKVTKSRTKLIFPRQNYWLSTTSSGCLFFSWARVSLMRKPLAPRGHTANKKTSTVLHWLGLSAITRLLWGFYVSPPFRKVPPRPLCEPGLPLLLRPSSATKVHNILCVRLYGSGRASSSSAAHANDKDRSGSLERRSGGERESRGEFTHAK